MGKRETSEPSPANDVNHYAPSPLRNNFFLGVPMKTPLLMILVVAWVSGAEPPREEAAKKEPKGRVTLKVGGPGVLGVAITADGRTLASAAGTIKLWDVATA